MRIGRSDGLGPERQVDEASKASFRAVGSNGWNKIISFGKGRGGPGL